MSTAWRWWPHADLVMFSIAFRTKQSWVHGWSRGLCSAWRNGDETGTVGWSTRVSLKMDPRGAHKSQGRSPCSIMFPLNTCNLGGISTFQTDEAIPRWCQSRILRLLQGGMVNLGEFCLLFWGRGSLKYVILSYSILNPYDCCYHIWCQMIW